MRLTLSKKDILQPVPGLVSELEQMVDRINTWSDAEHDPQTGEHTNIHVTGLNFTGATQASAGALLGYLVITVDGVERAIPYHATS